MLNLRVVRKKNDWNKIIELTKAGFVQHRFHFWPVGQNESLIISSQASR